tara:strand:- start:28 stop:447 length:420 start_codon:yes stop_codon:yes gene_type:complete
MIQPALSEIKSNIKINIPSEKSFGVFFSIFFLGIFIFYLFLFQEFNTWLLAISIILILLAFFFPKSLQALNKIWFNFGLLIGSIVAPIMMFFVYLVAVIPTGLVLRLFGKDPLNQKIDKSLGSYWVERTEKVGPMKNQF